MFFAESDPRPYTYAIGGGDTESKERRFIGYFMFQWELPTGERPIAVAVGRLCPERERAEVLVAVSRARFVLGGVRTIIRRSVYLDVAGEVLEVRDPEWASRIEPRGSVFAHLVPTRHGYWVPAPGWLGLPIALGPNLRAGAAGPILDPVALESFLQGRVPDEDVADSLHDQPEDDNLDAAVERMSDWARAHGQNSLLLTSAAWTDFVVPYMQRMDMIAWIEAVTADLEPSVEEYRELLGLLRNIWNNTPQPDRGGRSPSEIFRETRR